MLALSLPSLRGTLWQTTPGFAPVESAFEIAWIGVSFWDAMIVHAARQVEATVLWREDLSDGQDYGGVVARNPFKPPAPR